MSKVLIVVQARTQSSRLPGKTLLPLMGKSLLYRMIERLRMIKHKAEIVVATSLSTADDDIENEAICADVAYFRGSMYNLLDRHYETAKKYKADVVLKIPSDCPLIDPAAVDQVLDFYFANEGRYDYVSNLHPATWPDGNDVEIMTMACLHKAWTNARRIFELEHTTPYIWENPDRFRIGNVTMPGGEDLSMSHRFTIDYPDDYKFIVKVFEALYPANPGFGCQDILNLLQDRPDIYLTNAHLAGINWYRHHLDELKTVGQSAVKNGYDKALDLPLVPINNSNTHYTNA
jgi:spore coat polysaccharide biosynthesis protein SpsF